MTDKPILDSAGPIEPVDLRQALETKELLRQRELTALRDITPADEVTHYLVVQGIAELASEGSKLEGKYVWTNKFLRKTCEKLHPGNPVSQLFPRDVRRLFEEQGVFLKMDRTRNDGKLLILPDTPNSLLECLSKRSSIPIKELEGATEWSVIEKAFWRGEVTS